MGMLRAALYCRLSKDDMLQGDSESIKTQKAMLTQYAKEHSFLVVEIYVDDGYSGLNFDRPSFNRMLDDIEAGKIDVVITKDLSRLGRDHLKVGHFTEIYFPMKNVRYIAVNDGVDTANKNNDIAALKNVMNEFYSRDNSRKIRSSIRARAKAGLYRSSFNPIGYRKSPDNHNKLMVDEETAWIVKRIFELANAGMGTHKIAAVFREEQVPCPSWWLHSRGEKDYSKRFENPENKYEWSHTVIRNIISNPLYLGHCVMCKTESIFKVNASKKVPKEDWIKLIEEKGERLDEITVREICKRASVGLGLVNYHFGNKEKLIEQCIERMINGTVKRFQNIREKTDSFTPFEKLEYLSNMTLDFLFEHYAVSKISILTDMQSPKEGDNTYRTYEAYLPIVAACRPDLDEAAIKRKTLYLITVMQQMFLRYEIISQILGIDLRQKENRKNFHTQVLHDILEV